MQTASFSTHVGGMTCRPCEDAILDALLSVRGVLHAEVSYWDAKVCVTYDPDIVSEQSLRAVLTQAGYPPCTSASGGRRVELLTGAAVLLLLLLLPRLPLPAIPQVQAGANFAFLFLVGLVTGTHCICMCGGIMLSQTAAPDLRGQRRSSWKPFALYQAGRLCASTLLGVLFGSLGTVFSYSVKLKSMLYTLGGAAVLFIGLCTWGILPALRRIQAQLPALCRIPANARRMAQGKPYLVGVLNALLPCAASGAMWLYAASTGSALQGGISMLVWCLGTLPVMGIFSLIGNVLPRKAAAWFQRFGVVWMLVMGLRMAWKGLSLLVGC